MGWKNVPSADSVPPCAKERGGQWQYDDSGRGIDARFRKRGSTKYEGSGRDLTKAIRDAHPDC